MRLSDDHRLYTARWGIWTKRPPGRRTPLYNFDIWAELVAPYIYIFFESNSVSLLPRIVDKYRRNLVEPLKNSPRSVSNRAIIEKDRD